jgi:hypothetical protein
LQWQWLLYQIATFVPRSIMVRMKSPKTLLVSVRPQLSRLQRAEIFRLQANALQANALAAEGGMHQIGDVSTVRNTPEVGALFHNAFLLDPVQCQGQIGKDHDHIGVWHPVVDTEAPLELSASVQDHAKRAGNLRIHCL